MHLLFPVPWEQVGWKDVEGQFSQKVWKGRRLKSTNQYLQSYFIFFFIIPPSLNYLNLVSIQEALEWRSGVQRRNATCEGLGKGIPGSENSKNKGSEVELCV